jgi:hypothetical protein
MFKKIGKYLLISLGAFFLIAFIAYFIYLYNTYTLNPEQVVKEISILPSELISQFDQANLDEPSSCITSLEKIDNVLAWEIEDPIDFIQSMTFMKMTVSDEVAQQFEHVRKLADDTSFSFSFTALNSCEQNTFFKLDKTKLRQSLVELEESVKILNEIFVIPKEK